MARYYLYGVCMLCHAYVSTQSFYSVNRNLTSKFFTKEDPTQNSVILECGTNDGSSIEWKYKSPYNNSKLQSIYYDDRIDNSFRDRYNILRYYNNDTLSEMHSLVIKPVSIFQAGEYQCWNGKKEICVEVIVLKHDPECYIIFNAFSNVEICCDVSCAGDTKIFVSCFENYNATFEIKEDTTITSDGVRHSHFVAKRNERYTNLTTMINYTCVIKFIPNIECAHNKSEYDYIWDSGLISINLELPSSKTNIYIIVAVFLSIGLIITLVHIKIKFAKYRELCMDGYVRLTSNW